jgi:two-component system cell cycle response regulator DivK
MPKLIMLIEDTALHRKLFTIWLQMDGHTVHVVADERLAHTEAVTVRPDLIIADIRLPHIDGKDVIRTLKSRHDTRHIPVVALTVLNSREDQEACLAAGADTFLNKDTRRTDLLDAVRRF